MPKKLARSVTPRAAGVVFLLAALCAVAATASLQSARAAAPSPPVRVNYGFVPPVNKVHKYDNCPPSGCGSGKLLYHGGPVMTTNKVYTVFWAPATNPISATYINTINQFFQDVAHDSNMPTNVYASDTQYSSILYSSTYGGTFTDTNPFPANGCTKYGGGSVCLSGSQLQAELSNVATAQGWAKNSTSMFFMFTPKNVESCDSGSCAFTQYCAYHDYAGGMIWANQPYAASSLYPGNCDVGQYPNSNDADATINVTSHEHNEAITDPQVNTNPAWYDAAGYENGDKCAWTFGTRSGNSPNQYNQTINGHHYFLQEEFSNDTGTNGQCVQTHSIVGGGGSGPTVSSFNPTSGPVGTAVDIQGTNFTGATSVTFNNTPDTSFQVLSSTEISAHVPTGATTGPIAVTTPNGTGQSSSSFQVTTSGGGGPTVTSFTPTSGPVGTNVSITGTGFTGATGVTFGGTAATNFTVNSDTTIHANVPAGAQTGKIGVTTPNGTGLSSTNFTVTVVQPKPTITGFTPTWGYPGTKVTITGTNFTGATSVKLGSVPASFTVVSSTQITATVPREFFLGSYRWYVTTPAGTGASVTYFRYL